jgi:FdhD protein
MDSIEAFILVGGQSRRMGTDKSRLTLNGQSFVDRIAGQLSTITHTISVVGDLSAGAQNNLRSVPDVYPRWGALGGVHAALSGSSAEWAMIVACDFPFTTSQLFNRLASLREDFDAVAPVQEDLIPQPLCALYRIAICLPLAEQMIKSGERKPIALLQSVRTRWIPFSELSDLVGADQFFDNINTPEDYTRISQKGASSADRVMN